MKVYQSKCGLVGGASYEEVVARARREFNNVRRATRRQPYVRSKYFDNDKVFITLFWDHLAQKPQVERRRRLKFYSAALDLIRNTASPSDFSRSKDSNEVVHHRFYGLTRDKHEFCVQIKQNIRTGRKEFMSVFPVKIK